MPLGSLLVIQFFLLIIFSVLGPNLFGLTTAKSNPFVLLVLNVGLVVNAYFLLKNRAKTVGSPRPKKAFWQILMALLPLFLAYEELRKLWQKFDPAKISDVLPQLRAQNNWFFNGEFPYQWLKFETYSAFPVYMPLHWLPIQFSNLLGFDERWIGVLFVAAAIGVVVYFLTKNVATGVAGWKTGLGFWLISLPIWAFIVWSGLELAVSFELVVAAWYVLLAGGLAAGDLRLVGIGLAGCLLTRYTCFFWLPTFAVLLWICRPRRDSFWLWGGVAAAVLLLYVLPFVCRDPSVLATGVEYHNHCALDSWSRPHDDDFRQGINFAAYFKHLLGSSPESALFWMRAIQFLLMFALFAGGIFFYQKRAKNFLSFFDFALLELQLVISLFYLSSPMTFQYYLIVPLMTGAVLVWKALFSINSVNSKPL